MFSDESKRVVVIKDIHSNMIEEAILILRKEPDQDKGSGGKSGTEDSGHRSEDFLLKEAEIIIDTYIKQNKVPGDISKGQGRKKGSRGSILKTNTWISVSLIGSIAFLLFMISRLF